MNKKWEFLCQIALQHSSDKEGNIQQIFERLFSELFGYSWLSGEIDSHRVLHIGSTDRVLPDIIIRDVSANKDLFIVELKQLNLRFDKKFEEQLFSYMRLLSLNVGILICDAIYVYFLDNDNPISYKIAWNKQSADGERFLEMFNKGGFTVDAVKEFILERQGFEANIQKIKDELKQLDIKDIIKLYFVSNFEEAEIDVALQDFDFIVRENRKKTVPDNTDPPNPPPPGTGKEPIQKWVRKIFLYLLRNNILSEQEINALHDKEYTKKNFGISYSLFVDSQSERMISGHSRYWKNPIEGYYICSEWWVEKEREYESNIRLWLTKVLPDYIELGLDRKSW